MLRYRLLLIVALLSSLSVRGQYDCSFAHYSAKHGLSQYTVSMIYQDSKDVMWFGTFNGLNKFDGYRFKAYKPLSEQNETLADNRIDNILEDHFGILWIVTRDNRVLRFDPDTEQFFPVLKAKNGSKEIPVVTNIQKMPSGNMWLYTAGEGCYRVRPLADPREAEVVHFSIGNGMLPSHAVQEVFTSPDGEEWILTAGGITIVDSLSRMKLTGNEEGLTYLCGMMIGKELWCGLSDGRIRRFGTANAAFTETRLPMQSDIVGISPLNNEKVLLLTKDQGFILFNEATGQTEIYNRRRFPRIPSDRMVRATVDSHGEVWIETEDPGVVHFDPKGNEVRYFLPEVDQAGIYRHSAWSLVMEDINGYTWIYPKGGGFSFYDRRSRELRPFYNEPGNPASRFSNVIFQAFSDRQGNLWMNTYSRGIEKISFTRSPMQYFRPDPVSRAASTNEVRALAQISDGTVWCATRDGSLYIYDEDYRMLGKLGADGRLNSQPLFNSFVYDITEDGSGDIWLGTRNEGVFRLHPEGNNRYRIGNYRHNAAHALSISSDNIYAVYEDPNGRLWFGSWGGGINYLDPGAPEGAFVNYRNEPTVYPLTQFRHIRCITGDNRGNIWVGTTEGLVVLSRRSENKYRVSTYQRESGNTNSPAANDIHNILVAGDTVWLATFGGGLNRLVRDSENGEPRFTAFHTGNGFPSDIVLTLEEDPMGLLWMSSENEVIRFDPKRSQAETFTTYTPEYEGDINFSEGASLLDARGNMVFGHNVGAYRFDPATISKSSFVPRIMFTQLLLFNREVSPGEENSPLERNIDDTGNIRLKHHQSVFSLEFAALDYNNSEAIEYAYMLEGFDKEWNYAGSQRVAAYTNLPYGKYTLKVCSTNADRVWADNTRVLHIEMMPPFWRTGWAYALYVFAFLSLLLLAFRIFFSFYRLRNEMQLEHRVTEMKLRFFTDISHEIRTPLTLISTPVEHLLASDGLNHSARNTLGLVKTNTDRLLRLVNQLLDFRKIQHRKMKMHIEQVAVASFTALVCDTFVPEGERHRIRFTFRDYSDGAKLWVDKDKLEKILFNLLSNAFKFTPDGKTITCTVSNDVNEMAITVRDEGIGIPPEILENLFVRFESTGGRWHTSGQDPSPSIQLAPNRPGTGIGLSLTKELVDLHFGQIDVESHPGSGTKITVRFRKGRSHYTGLEGYTILSAGYEKEADETDREISRAKNRSTPLDNGDFPEWAHPAENRSTILFIEDNDELRLFLTEITGGQYQVLEADNGEAGLDLARKAQPDIIISDIMMEGIDGLELMRRLREDISTSHIPVILLTARSGLDDRVQAMESGADDYIVKPFSSTYLLARIANLLEQRLKLQQSYAASIGLSSSSGTEESIPSMHVSSADAGFMEKLRSYMEENLADPDLRIDGLMRHLCISRSLLFKKVKSLTGLSPVEYIREYRVRRATELIRNPDLSIKEITYLVGMNDARYFARCFKQKHGVSPSEYRANIPTGEPMSEA